MLSEHIEFRPETDAEVFSSVAAAPAVFLLRGEDANSEPYVSKTANLRRRLQRLLSVPQEQTKRLNLRDRVRWIEYTPTGSDFESDSCSIKRCALLFPKPTRIACGCASLRWSSCIWKTNFPALRSPRGWGESQERIFTTGRLFRATAAEKFMNDALDFFKMRRCVEDLHPDPKFPGCVYSEMKMCLAPCFRGCTDDEYRAEVVRVEDFLDSRGESLKRQLATERDNASVKMEFEAAAAVHARLDKLTPVLQQLPEFVQRIDQMHAVIVQKSAQKFTQKSRQPESVALFRVDAGAIAGPLEFPISGGRTHEIAIDGSANSGRAERIPRVQASQRHRAHGAPGDLEALVLSRHSRGRDFLRRCQGGAANAATGARNRPRVQRRSARDFTSCNAGAFSPI